MRVDRAAHRGLLSRILREKRAQKTIARAKARATINAKSRNRDQPKRRCPPRPCPLLPPPGPAPGTGRGFIGRRPSRCIFLRASLRALRIASAFSRAFFSDGFRNGRGASSRGKCPRAASSSSAPSGLGRRCCRERVLARLLLRCCSDGFKAKAPKSGALSRAALAEKPLRVHSSCASPLPYGHFLCGSRA
jgi:hypothetical protein